MALENWSSTRGGERDAHAISRSTCRTAHLSSLPTSAHAPLREVAFDERTSAEVHVWQSTCKYTHIPHELCEILDAGDELQESRAAIGGAKRQRDRVYRVTAGTGLLAACCCHRGSLPAHIHQLVQSQADGLQNSMQRGLCLGGKRGNSFRAFSWQDRRQSLFQFIGANTLARNLKQQRNERSVGRWRKTGDGSDAGGLA